MYEIKITLDSYQLKNIIINDNNHKQLNVYIKILPLYSDYCQEFWKLFTSLTLNKVSSNKLFTFKNSQAISTDYQNINIDIKSKIQKKHIIILKKSNDMFLI